MVWIEPMPVNWANIEFSRKLVTGSWCWDNTSLTCGETVQFYLGRMAKIGGKSVILNF